MTFTEQMVKDVGITLGMSEDKSLAFYHHYNAQDWFFGSGLKITNLKSAMWRWKNNGFREKNGVFGKKQRMFPIPGKICLCGMPAVYKDTSGNYDSFKCADCMPEKVKEKYEG